MTSSLFPDVNVWLALTHDRHVHCPVAREWLASVDAPLSFCRFTQLSFLRLLTTAQVMGAEVMSQRNAWQVYKRWFEDERVQFLREPETEEFETYFIEFSSKQERSPKVWADAYLAAFALSARLTLVTFDRALASISSLPVVLLPPPM